MIGLGMSATASRSFAAVLGGIESLMRRAVPTSSVWAGSTSVRNQGSTGMQCPPTPIPGLKISTRGCALAISIALSMFTPRPSAIMANSFASAMLTSRYVFSMIFELRRYVVCEEDLSSYEGFVDCLCTIAGFYREGAYYSVVVHNFLKDISRENSFRTVNEAHVRIDCESGSLLYDWCDYFSARKRR